MKFINAHSTKAVALATGAILAVSVITLVPWRLVAQETQEPSAAPTGPRSSAPTPPEGTGRYGLSAMGERGTSRMPMAAPRPPTDVAPARFEATVYEVEVPEGRISDLDARALEAKAATPQDLTKALGEFGKTRVMHKIDQTVNLYGENIMLGTSEPMVTGSRRMTSGEAVNTITYQQVGLIVSLSASAPPKESSRKGLDVQVNFNLSAFVDSGVELASGVKASSVRTVQLSQSGTPKFGKPSVLLNVSAAAGGDKVPPVAYVVRYSFSESKP